MDKTCVLFSYYDYEKAILYIIDEIVLDKAGMTTELLAQKIKEKEKHWKFEAKNTVRRGDTNNPILITDMSRLHQLPFGIVKKDNLEAMVNLVNIWFAQGRIKIGANCKYLISCVENGLWTDTLHSDFKRTKTLGHLDGSAALMYLVRSINVHDNTVPLPANTIDPFGNQVQRIGQTAMGLQTWIAQKDDFCNGFEI